MKQALQIASIYTMLLGLFLLVEGIWGLFSPITFGILTTNSLQTGIAMVGGIVGIWLGAAEKPRGFCIFLGSFLLFIGVLRFVPGADKVIVEVLRVNYAVASLDIVMGVFSLIMAMITRKHHGHALKITDGPQPHR